MFTKMKVDPRLRELKRLDAAVADNLQVAYYYAIIIAARVIEGEEQYPDELSQFKDFHHEYLIHQERHNALEVRLLMEGVLS